MILKNKTYDFYKWLVLIFLPALAVFLQGIGEIYHINNIEKHVTCLNIFCVFIGSILQISNHNYKNGGNKHE